MGIVYNEGTTETVTILGGEVAVIPESAYSTSSDAHVNKRSIVRKPTCLIGFLKLILEGVASGDGTLRDSDGTVSPSGSMLNDSVPVL